MKTAYQAQYF